METPPPLPPDLPPPLPVKKIFSGRPQVSSVPAVVVSAGSSGTQTRVEPVRATITSPASARLWWVWVLASVFACLVMFVVCMNCNPLTTAADRAIGKLQGAIAQQLDPQLHPLLSWGMNLLFNKYIALPYAQAQAAGFTFAFFACLVLPLGCSFLSAALGHPVFMIGGAPGGWRSTWQSYGLHRFICDLASLLVIAVALIVPMEPITAASVLIVFLPTIRFGSMIALWVLLARSHGFGPVRIIFLGLPNILIVSLFSGMLAFALALYLYAYLVARTF